MDGVVDKITELKADSADAPVESELAKMLKVTVINS
jgi:hypothetical protein